MNSKGKITLLQACMFTITVTYLPIIRQIHYIVKISNEAALVLPFISCIINLLSIFTVYYFIRKYPQMSYCDILYNTIGRVAGKIILTAYLLWFIILQGIIVRQTCEKLLMSLYPNENLSIMMIIILFVAFLITRKGIASLSRMNLIFVPFLIIQVLLIVALIIPKSNLENLLPISKLDIIPAAKGLPMVSAFGSYIFAIIFIADKIKKDDKIIGKLFWGSYAPIITLQVILTVLMGTLGSEILSVFPLSFLPATKYISSKYAGLESVFISFWNIADFIQISLLTYIILTLFKSIFNLERTASLLSIIMIFTFYTAQLILKDYALIQNIYIFRAYMNELFFLFIPFIIMLISMLKEKHNEKAILSKSASA